MDSGVAAPGSFAGADAGLHLLLRLPGPLDEGELVRRAAEQGVGVYPLSSYCLTAPDPHRPPTLVMGYARLDAADMAPAFRLLRRAWQS